MLHVVIAEQLQLAVISHRMDWQLFQTTGIKVETGVGVAVAVHAKHPLFTTNTVAGLGKNIGLGTGRVIKLHTNMRPWMTVSGRGHLAPGFMHQRSVA